jgi:hypothetical protein
MTISADEFLRRFLRHTLPRGFLRIRFPEAPPHPLLWLPGRPAAFS